MIRLFLAVAVTLLLAGCGGHGSSSPSPPPNNQPASESLPLAPSRKGLLFGYFGSDDAQTQEVADHESLAFIAFGSDEQLARRMAEAGPPCVLDVSDCLFTTDGNPRHYRGDPEAERLMTARLDACARVVATTAPDVPFSRFVLALYLIDEPERESNVPVGEIQQAAELARRVAAGFGLRPALHICYGDGKDYRGLDCIDWAGVDAYGKGAGVLSDDVEALKAALRGEQWLVLYPGGADPWRNDPVPFYAYAQTHPKVIAIVPFIWISPWGGTTNKGIRDNGMADAYRAVGIAIKQGAKADAAPTGADAASSPPIQETTA